MDIDKESTSASEKFIVFHRFYINYPVEILESAEEIAIEKAIEYEYNSIVTSGVIGEYAMEPNTVHSHVDFAKYLEEKLNTPVNYFREDGTPQILWDFPTPSGITKENVKDITAITKFRKYHVLNGDEWSKGDYIVIFSNKMEFGIEGLRIDNFIFEDYADAVVGALKILLETSYFRSCPITDYYSTKSEQFSILLKSLKYFKYHPDSSCFQSNINIDDLDDLDDFNELELEELVNEVDRIWHFLGYYPYRLEQL